MKPRRVWMRLYCGVINDPKVQRLPPHLFKAWINVLCLAGSNGGSLPAIEDTAFALRMPVDECAKVVDDLIAARLVDVRADKVMEPHDWSVWQYESDSSTERVRKHRENKAKTRCNVSCNVSETPPEQNREEEFYTAPLEQVAARRAVKGAVMPTADGVRFGSVSAVAVERVLDALNIGEAAPLVERYRMWPGRKPARDPDAHFIGWAKKFWPRLTIAEQARCKPKPPRPEPPGVKPEPYRGAAGASLKARLRRGH